MRQNEVFPYYKKYVEELNSVYDLLKSSFDENYVDELCAIRGYVSDDQRALISNMELGISAFDDVSILEEYSEELGLLSKRGNFLLSNRFIIPVYSISGDLISLIGFYPDSRKYITLSTPFFAKNMLFFNYKDAYEKAWGSFDGLVFLVEGIFDCLSLRSIGLPAIATMGATVSAIKGEQLKFFKKVIAIPDDDKAGRKALDRYSKYGWKVPSNTTLVKFIGGEVKFDTSYLHCKDMDNFVSWYDKADVYDTLLSLAESREEVEELCIA